MADVFDKVSIGTIIRNSLLWTTVGISALLFIIAVLVIGSEDKQVIDYERQMCEPLLKEGLPKTANYKLIEYKKHDWFGMPLSYYRLDFWNFVGLQDNLVQTPDQKAANAHQKGWYYSSFLRPVTFIYDVTKDGKTARDGFTCVFGTGGTVDKPYLPFTQGKPVLKNNPELETMTEAQRRKENYVNFLVFSGFNQLNSSAVQMIFQSKSNYDQFKKTVAYFEKNKHLPKDDDVFAVFGYQYFPVLRQVLDDPKFNVNITDRNGNSLLHYAASYPSTEITQELLAHKVFVNSVNKDGDTPLHRASFSRSVDNVRLLLQNGADKTAKNANDKTALDIAKSHGYIDIVKILQ